MTLEELARLPDRIDVLERKIKELESLSIGNAKSVYTVREAADYMGVSSPAIYEWIRCGKLPTFKLNRDGKTHRIYRKDLDALIERLKEETA